MGMKRRWRTKNILTCGNDKKKLFDPIVATIPVIIGAIQLCSSDINRPAMSERCSIALSSVDIEQFIKSGLKTRS